MALVGNRSAINKSPGRWLAGLSVSDNRNGFNQHGMMRSAFQALSPLSAWPNGHVQSAWVLPRTAGGMSSHNVAGLTLSATGDGAMGVNIDGTASLAITAQAAGELIASAIGAASISLSVTGDIVATLSAEGSATITLASAGSLEALAWAEGAATVAMTASLVSYAIGVMSGSTADSGVLTPDQIAQAVWSHTQ
ncbi:MAG: hypothetical protein K2Y25_00760 [Pseudomonadaceae bacterium]|nr:hypothetical protein [Pseudomonadaceae bacterium]